MRFDNRHNPRWPGVFTLVAPPKPGSAERMWPEIYNRRSNHLALASGSAGAADVEENRSGIVGHGVRRGVATSGWLIRRQSIRDGLAVSAEVGQIALVGCVRPALVRELTASRRRPNTARSVRLGAKLDHLCIRCHLAAVIDRAGNKADPISIDSQPPITVVEVICGAEFVLHISRDAAGKRCSQNALVRYLIKSRTGQVVAAAAL